MLITPEPRLSTQTGPIFRQGILGTDWALNLKIKSLSVETFVRTHFSHHTSWTVEECDFIVRGTSIDIHTFSGRSLTEFPLDGCIPISFMLNC